MRVSPANFINAASGPKSVLPVLSFTYAARIEHETRRRTVSSKTSPSLDVQVRSPGYCIVVWYLGPLAAVVVTGSLMLRTAAGGNGQCSTCRTRSNSVFPHEWKSGLFLSASPRSTSLYFVQLRWHGATMYISSGAAVHSCSSTLSPCVITLLLPFPKTSSTVAGVSNDLFRG